MAKLIVVTREELEASQVKFEKLLAEDPRLKEELRELHHYEIQEKIRRDTEYAAKQKRSSDSGEEAK